MTKLFMLDTDAVSYIARGRPPEYRQRVREIADEQLCISAITVAEILVGLEALPSNDIRQLAARNYLGQINVIPWDETAAPMFASIQYYLKTTGQRIGEMDVLIAAHAMALGATLVTGNVRHHGRVPGLEIVDWRVRPSSGD